MAYTAQWQDLFIMIDDGHVTIADYTSLEPKFRAQVSASAKGVGCLIIIPINAAMPPARIRQHLQDLLKRLPLRALAYLVEGTGFRAAAVRGVLISLGIFQREACPTKVVTSLDDALSWLLPPPHGQADLRRATKVIDGLLAQYRTRHPGVP